MPYSSDPLVAKIITDSRVVLFDEDLVAKDDSAVPEEPPKPKLSGMGASSGSKGFGNTPVSKENLGHKVLDIIDKVTNIPDERAEVLKMCLENSPTGAYEPVQPMTKSVMKTSSSSSTMNTSFVLKGKKHKPGKAGGGWGSSEEEEEDLGQQSLSEVSLTSPMKDSIMIDSACEAIEDFDLPEIQAIKDYSSAPNMPTLKEIEECFQTCQSVENSTVFEHFKVSLESNEEVFKTIRVLLLIERFLRTNVGIEKYEDLKEVLKQLESDKNSSVVAIKAKKVNLIIKRRAIS